MKAKRGVFSLTLLVLAVFFLSPTLSARTKMVALPERDKALIRLDNPLATLIEEERVLTLQKGLNKVDFSWKGVSIDADSIRLAILTHRDKVALLSVSYPPDEAALVWDIASKEAIEVTARISYLLSFMDRLIAYKLISNPGETRVDLKSFLVLRNFSGETFRAASVLLDQDRGFDLAIDHEETRQVLLMENRDVALEKIWTFDAEKLPWDPEKVEGNVGIPVSYRIRNAPEAGLGKGDLCGGKVRVFQQDGKGGTIFLGEDLLPTTPVGEEMKITIGDSRDIVVTQQKMKEDRINVRRNQKNQAVLYDTDERIKAIIENFKDAPASLTMIQHIPGQWDMEECNMRFERRDAYTLEFEIPLPPHGKQELLMHYHRRNVR